MSFIERFHSIYTLATHWQQPMHVMMSAPYPIRVFNVVPCAKEQSSCSAINSMFFSFLMPAALLAVCFCCPESLDVLQTWVKELQKTHVLLKVTPILFDVNIPVDLPVRSNSL